MTENPPYLLSPGSLVNALTKIKDAATPERFTQDFMQKTIGMKGGSGRAIVPFLKRVGFLGSDGTPTEWYNKFRNSNYSGVAGMHALRTGYKALFDMNTKAHKLNDTELLGLVVQATGAERKSRMVQAILGTFKALKGFAVDDVGTSVAIVEEEPHSQKQRQAPPPPNGHEEEMRSGVDLKLAYTINLNLPATTDIKVFDAIFKSLKENMLK